MLNFELDEFHAYHQSSEIKNHLDNSDWYKIKFNNIDIDDFIEFSEILEETKILTIYKIKVKTVGGVLDCLKILFSDYTIYCASAEHAVLIRKSCVVKLNDFEKYLYCIVWEDDIGGLQALETHKITSEEELNRIDDFIMDQANYFIASKPFDLTDHLFWDIADQWLSANNDWNDDTKLKEILSTLGLIEIEIDEDDFDYQKCLKL